MTGMRIYTHPACLDHDPGAGHAESPARLRAVLQALDAPAFHDLERVAAPPATREQLLRHHHRGAWTDVGTPERLRALCTPAHSGN